MQELSIYAPMLPEIALALGAMAILMFGVFKKDGAPGADYASGWLAVIVLVIAAGLVVYRGDAREVLFEGAFISDAFSRFSKLLVLAGAALVLVMSFDSLARAKLLTAEFCVLTLLAVTGMLLMVSAGNLIALFLGLELQSLALYVIAAIDRNQVRSSEAGLKYFVLGSLSSGMLLYGASLIYGFTGSIDLAVIATVAQGQPAAQNIGLIVGLVFLLVGLAFKIGAVPFHMWTPDVYEGAPTPVTAFFAAAPKLAAMALLVRTLLHGLPRHRRAVAADHRLPLHRLDAARRLRRHRPAQHQAADGLLVDRPHRLRADRPRRQQRSRHAVGARLPRHLPRHDRRHLRLHPVDAHGRGAGGGHRMRCPASPRPTCRWPSCWPCCCSRWPAFPRSPASSPSCTCSARRSKPTSSTLAVIGVLASVVGAYYYLRLVKIMFFDDAKVAFLPVERGAGIVMALSGAFVLLFVLVPAPLANAALTAARALHVATTAAVQ